MAKRRISKIMGYSEKIQTIDIKSILLDIRNEIKEKGYINDLPVFDDSPDQQFLTNIMNDIFEISDEEYDYLKILCEVEPNKQLNGNKLVVFIKKIIRKLNKFYVIPIVKDQNAFNFFILRVLLKNYEMKKQIIVLYDRVTRLEELLHEEEKA
jgi:hypothetical protein